jgi:hypothetical protein
MRDFNIGLRRTYESEIALGDFRNGRTYADVVVQVVAHGQVDPLIRRDHARSVAGRLDDIQLVLGANAA